MDTTFKIAAIIFIMFAVTIGFIVIAGDTIGMTDADARTMGPLIVGAVVVTVAFYGVTQSSGYMLSATVGVFGFAMVYLVHVLNEAGILIPGLEMSVTHVKIVVMAFFILIAGCLAVGES